MAITRFRQGDVTMNLTGDLADLCRRAVEAAGGETLRLVEAAAEEVAANARTKWYRQVDRETGKSGDIQVFTTVYEDKIRVSVGSTDTRTAGRGSKPVVVYIKRPKRRSKIERDATDAERADGTADRWGHVDVPNPKAADGKFLLNELIRKPVTLKIKALTPELARLIAARARGGR